MSVNVFSTKALIGETIYVSYWRRDRHFTWSSEPREGLAICRAKAVISFHFSVILRPWVLVQSRESNPRPPALQSIALPSELILPRLKRFLKRFSTSFRSKSLLWEISMNHVSQSFYKTWHFTLGLPSVMLWRPIQSHKTHQFFINLLIRTQLTTSTSLRNCNKKVQRIFFDEMYQHIDAKKLSFRLKEEGVLVDQKEGKHYKKTKFKQTYESSLSTIIIKNQSLSLK